MRKYCSFALPFVAVGVVLLALPQPATAQRFPGLGSIEGRVGAYLPNDADAGYGISVDVGLGYLGSPVFRVLAGFNFFAADVDRDIIGTGVPVSGSFTATGGRVGLRLDPFGAGRFTPYLIGAVTGHSVSTDADSETDRERLDRLYGDFLVGAAFGAGLTYSFDVEDRYALTVEGRRGFAPDIGHWAAEAGFRITPRGRNAYAPVARVVPVSPPVAVAPPDATTEAAREEAARAAAERERLRAERERLARMTEEERARAQRENEALRNQADTLVAARQREAEARAAAERDAAQARAQTEAAQAAAREAEQRAAAAEGRLYDALLDLDRLITNVTEIRETERGLVVVLGQGLFSSGQSTLSARARDEVGRIAAVLSQFPERSISVEGHTDAVGSEVANQRLSEQRAEAVRAALIAQGVDPGRVDMVGYGESRPAAENDTAQGRAQNRRVEIVILGARRPATDRE
jgi:outer membrane protein OmpA-like peptidoglycan-associated protein